MKITVSRKYWGTGIVEGGQLRHEGTWKKCCLGFACLQAGVENLGSQIMPSGVVMRYAGSKRPKVVEKLTAAGLIVKRTFSDGSPYYDDTEFSKEAAIINDSDEIVVPRREKERRLRELAKKHGHRFVFKP